MYSVVFACIALFTTHVAAEQLTPPFSNDYLQILIDFYDKNPSYFDDYYDFDSPIINGSHYVGFLIPAKVLNSSVSFPNIKTKVCIADILISQVGLKIDNSNSMKFNYTFVNCTTRFEFSVSGDSGLTIAPTNISFLDCEDYVGSDKSYLVPLSLAVTRKAMKRLTIYYVDVQSLLPVIQFNLDSSLYWAN